MNLKKIHEILPKEKPHVYDKRDLPELWGMEEKYNEAIQDCHAAFKCCKPKPKIYDSGH